MIPLMTIVPNLFEGDQLNLVHIGFLNALQPYRMNFVLIKHCSYYDTYQVQYWTSHNHDFV